MRASRTVVSIGLTLGLAYGATGCDAVNEATNVVNSANDTAQKAQLCLDAVRVLGFTPDLSDPKSAVDEAHRKADELAKLSDSAADTAVKSALETAASQLETVRLSDLDPASAATWLQQKANNLNALNTACRG
jgi:hypothetical protein